MVRSTTWYNCGAVIDRTLAKFLRTPLMSSAAFEVNVNVTVTFPLSFSGEVAPEVCFALKTYVSGMTLMFSLSYKGLNGKINK